jgi:hypothetical protein
MGELWFFWYRDCFFGWGGFGNDEVVRMWGEGVRYMSEVGEVGDGREW